MSVFEKNQNIIEPKILRDFCLGVVFFTRDGSQCSSCGAFTKDTCDGMRANMVFCSTHVFAYPSFTFNHPFANWRIFVACVGISPIFSSWNDRSLSFCFFSVFFPKETGKTVSENVDVGHFGHIVLPMPVYHPFHLINRFTLSVGWHASFTFNHPFKLNSVCSNRNK